MAKKILIAIDKFKGSLTSLEAAQAIERGMRKAYDEHLAQHNGSLANLPELEFNIVPIADGGDGSASVLQSVIPGVEEIATVAVNPLGHEIETSFLIYNSPDSCANRAVSACSADERSSVKRAFIEMAKVSGLALIGEQERNPMITTTYGLGQLVKEAYLQGAREITLSIGGSATNDGGTGMLQAIGFKFFNKAGELITDYMCGGLLSQIGRIEAPDNVLEIAENVENLSGNIFKDCKINVVCDVTNPLLGSEGATYVYGPQKGADSLMLTKLEAGMDNLVKVAGDSIMANNSMIAGNAKADGVDYLAAENKVSEAVQFIPGAGAAGGVGYAVLKFLNGNLISGWRFFAGITNLEELIASADLVISGEGRIDSQSFSGKVIDGVATMCQQYNKKLVLFCGINELTANETSELCYNILAMQELSSNHNIQGVFSRQTESSGKITVYELKTLEPDRVKSMQNAAILLEQLSYRCSAVCL